MEEKPQQQIENSKTPSFEDEAGSDKAEIGNSIEAALTAIEEKYGLDPNITKDLPSEERLYQGFHAYYKHRLNNMLSDEAFDRANFLFGSKISRSIDREFAIECLIEEASDSGNHPITAYKRLHVFCLRTLELLSELAELRNIAAFDDEKAFGGILRTLALLIKTKKAELLDKTEYLASLSKDLASDSTENWF